MGSHRPHLRPLSKTHISWERRPQGSTAASCSAWDLGHIPSPTLGLGFLGAPTASAALGVPRGHLVVVLCCFAKDLYFRHGGIGELPRQLGSGLGWRICNPSPPASCPDFFMSQAWKGHFRQKEELVQTLKQVCDLGLGCVGAVARGEAGERGLDVEGL